jgi:hypothetical protein
MTHLMQFIATHADGRTEWYCPTCGRHFLMDADFHREILQAGDASAQHTGGTGGIVIQGLEMREPRLDVFAEWAKGHDLEGALGDE